jgi:hypothetical protein
MKLPALDLEKEDIESLGQLTGDNKV